jgi:hypothetical protein
MREVLMTVLLTCLLNQSAMASLTLRLVLVIPERVYTEEELIEQGKCVEIYEEDERTLICE